jgi:hypothetical protein
VGGMVVKCCGTDVVAAEVRCSGAGLEIFSGGFRWLWCGDGVVGLVRPMVLVAATGLMWFGSGECWCCVGWYWWFGGDEME